MSKISTIYDQLEGVVTTLLPEHKELSNPYFPETSDDLSYSKAYGIAFGAGVNDTPNVDNMRTETKTQDFIVSLTRRIFSKRTDTTTRKDAEKALMEDQRLLTNSLSRDKFLGDCKLILAARYISHDGIEFVRIERQDIIIVRSLIQIRYNEAVV